MLNYMWIGHHDSVKNYKWTAIWGNTLYRIINILNFLQYECLSR